MNLKLLANQVFSRTGNETPVKQSCEQEQKKVFHPESEMKHQMEAEKPDPVPFHTDGREIDLSNDGEAWLCPDCGQPVEINDVFPDSDGAGMLTLWSCEPCQVKAVTPDVVKRPPANFEPSRVAHINSTPELPPLDPALQRKLEAAIWLEDHLTEPRRIGEICAQWTGGVQRIQRNGALRWEGGRDGTDGHWMTDLCEAAKLLGVTAFNGPDDRFWWTVPETAEQAQKRLNAA